jgi:hypothetical protein
LTGVDVSKQPAVKGSLLLGAVVAVRRLRDRGRVPAEQLAARLSGAALELIDQKIDVARWYPVAAFCELLDVNWEVAGNRDPEFMRQQGAQTVERLFDRGIYHQLDYAQRVERVQSRDALVRQARLITTITGTLYDFLEVEVCVDPERPDQLEIRYHNAAEYSEALRYTTEGFMNQINRQHGSARSWTSERPRPDFVIFRLPLPTRFTEG